MADRADHPPENRFALRDGWTPRIARIGRSGEPVIVVDRVMRDPAALIDRAAAATFLPAGGDQGGYPGVRAPAPRDYAARLARAVDPLIRATFAETEIVPVRADSAFSIVTRPAGSLHPMQRVPHIDTASPLRFALLHFLCGPPFGGTSFFRQKRTGIEQVTPENYETFSAARRLDLAELAPPSGYPGPATPGYERIAAFAARLDRLLIYRSVSLHSGIIAADLPLPSDPRRGRLTANIFIDYKPAGRPGR